ncbi:MAG: PilZ domain-containing protein [Candidatus Omnitrophica bacterium]|nr:PilZ domain-containing protein [Candidatus Omnitrophota bacterium]
MWDGVDRRRSLRAEYPCLITLRKTTVPMQAILTHTEDISLVGVRVIIGKKIEPLSEVDLEIDLMDTLPTIISKGQIRWVKEIPSRRKGKASHYDTGIQFIALKPTYRKRIERIVEHFSNKTG